MATETDIANLAASKIGADTRITSLDDDRTIARTLRSVWTLERRATIRDGSWNFAARRAELAAKYMPDGVPYPFKSSFPLPAECLRLIEVLNLAARSDYQLEGNAILAHTDGPLYIRFLSDIEEASYWDDAFAEAFACRLAWRTGKRIAGSNYSEQQGERDYRTAISAAKRVDARENPPIPNEESDWVLARGAYGYGAGCGNPLLWG